MGLNEFFVGMFHGSQHTAVGKNRPYFLRSVELVKALKGLSDLKGNAQKELPKLYDQLQQVLEMAADASGRDARKGEDEKLNKMFDEAIHHVRVFLQMHASANQAQLFTDNMKKAWEGDSGSVTKMSIMKGRIYEMMKKYETMKKTTYLLRHWLQPKLPSINTSDWVEYALLCPYDVEDGITTEEFLNRLLTNMMTEKTRGLRKDFLLLSPRLYHRPIVDKCDFSNFMLRRETLAPTKPTEILNEIKNPKFELAFEFADNKITSLQDLIHRTFDTDVEEVLGWIDKWKNVFWSRCPADNAFKWTGNKEKNCLYMEKPHEGHVIYRDEEGNMQHMLILKSHIRKEPLSDKEKFDPKKVLQKSPEPANHLNIGESQRKLGRSHMARPPPPPPKKQGVFGRIASFWGSSKDKD